MIFQKESTIVENIISTKNWKFPYMPKYIPKNNYLGYSIKIRPVGLRRIFRIWPYAVGDNVKLHCSIKKVSEKAEQNPLSNLALVEIHPNRSQKSIKNFNSIYGIADALKSGHFEFTFESMRVSQQGDFSIYLGGQWGEDSDGLLFSTNFYSPDIINLQIFFIILGAIITFISGILFGFIDIVKFWKIWIP